jgi:hypothetical protein
LSWLYTYVPQYSLCHLSTWRVAAIQRFASTRYLHNFFSKEWVAEIN